MNELDRLVTETFKQNSDTAQIKDGMDLAFIRINYKKKEIEANLKTARRNLMGRVLAVNQAWNFVVLSIGDKNGVLSNTELIVKRGSTEIGRVRITSVEPSTSIADIIPTSITRGLSIQPGDEVIFKNPEE